MPFIVFECAAPIFTKRLNETIQQMVLKLCLADNINTGLPLNVLRSIDAK